MSIIFHRCIPAIVLASSLIALIGCGGSHRQLPPTVPVSATVTLNGHPLEEAEITFSPVLPGPASNGKVADGQLINLSANGHKPGVAAGDYKVTIYDQPMEFGGRELVPNDYGRIENGFDVTVTDEGPNEFNFQLTGK